MTQIFRLFIVRGGGEGCVMNNCNNLCIFSVISGIKIAAGHDVGLTLDLI